MGHSCAHFFLKSYEHWGVIAGLLPGLSPRELPSSLPRALLGLAWGAYEAVLLIL